MKVYSKATCYSFQGPTQNSSGSEEENFGFSINDFLGPHQRSVCNFCRVTRRREGRPRLKEKEMMIEGAKVTNGEREGLGPLLTYPGR
jgi:hypothetical protein